MIGVQVGWRVWRGRAGQWKPLIEQAEVSRPCGCMCRSFALSSPVSESNHGGPDPTVPLLPHVRVACWAKTRRVAGSSVCMAHREPGDTEASTASARPGTDTCTKKAGSPLTDSQPYIFRAIEGLAVEFAVRAPPPPLPSPLHYTPSLTLWHMTPLTLNTPRRHTSNTRPPLSPPIHTSHHPLLPWTHRCLRRFLHPSPTPSLPIVIHNPFLVC